MEMTSSFLMLVISLISLREGKGQVSGGPGAGTATHPRGRPAHLMVICGRSPLSDLSPIRISRMVWDQ